MVHRRLPVNPRALFDPEGRRKLAAIVVWGSNGARFNRAQIEKRLERALERIAEKVLHGNRTKPNVRQASKTVARSHPESYNIQAED